MLNPIRGFLEEDGTCTIITCVDSKLKGKREIRGTCVRSAVVKRCLTLVSPN